MLNARLYRAALVPLVIALAIAAFSLGGRAGPYTTTLAPDAFEGKRAAEDLRSLAAAYPSRRPGSAGDEALAEHVAADLRELGGTAGGGFTVQVARYSARTLDGRRDLATVYAQRPGSTNETPIVIVAHRDSAGRGAEAELSGTAALLELARVFASRETKRAIVLVSTSGGSAGDAGAAELVSGSSPLSEHAGVDAAIVLGDLASAHQQRPVVIPYSDGMGSAPLSLQRTVDDAITREAGTNPGAPSVLGQLAHLTFPFAPGEQGVLQAAGIPSVLVQASGERGPAAGAAVDVERLEGLGRGVLSAVDALDTSPDVARGAEKGLVLQRKVLPGWTMRLLVLALIFAPLMAAADGLARVRRRREPAGRWVLWTLTCALPFLCCAVFAFLLGRIGVIGAPALPGTGRVMRFDGTALAVVLAVALTFALAWMLWARLVRRLGWGVRPDPEVVGLSLLVVLTALCAVVWVGNPYTALLLVPATHLWLLLAAPELRPRRLGAIALYGAGLLPLAALIVFYAHQFGLGPGSVAWTAVELVAGGHVGLGSALLWSVGLGSAAAAAMLVFSGPGNPMPAGTGGTEITIRGPLSYAGPGSLGGTESALRR